jgi:hypothetical protein
MASPLILAQIFLGAGYLSAAVYLAGSAIKSHIFRPVLAAAFAVALLHFITLLGPWHDHPVPFQLVLGLAAVVSVRRNEVLFLVFFTGVVLLQVEFVQATHLARHMDPSWATAETLIGGAVLTLVADLFWAAGLALGRGFRAGFISGSAQK